MAIISPRGGRIHGTASLSRMAIQCWQCPCCAQRTANLSSKPNTFYFRQARLLLYLVVENASLRLELPQAPAQFFTQVDRHRSPRNHVLVVLALRIHGRHSRTFIIFFGERQRRTGKQDPQLSGELLVVFHGRQRYCHRYPTSTTNNQTQPRVYACAYESVAADRNRKNRYTQGCFEASRHARVMVTRKPFAKLVVFIVDGRKYGHVMPIHEMRASPRNLWSKPTIYSPPCSLSLLHHRC